ncbi:MAG TPA: alpha/beta hydrolase [Micromonosporaceae bacterium]|jgi:pimeloyl-ACP methyl ester carboxylesterase
MTMPVSSTIPPSWNATSHTVDIGGDVHYVDFGGAESGPPVILVHGLGGSYANWGLLGPRLAVRHRVYALDLVGFGLTFPAGRSGSVHANAALLSRFAETVAGEPALLVGNSMGGMISMMLAAAQPKRVTGLVLLDPALPRAASSPNDRQVAAQFLQYAIPGVGERLLERRRLTTPPRQMVAETLALCSPHPERVPAEMIDAAVDLIGERAHGAGLDRAYLQAARSLLRFGARRRRYLALMRGLSMPVLLLHGEKDRLVPVQSARAAAANAPEWTFETLPDVGHIPMMEIPDVVDDRIATWTKAQS